MFAFLKYHWRSAFHRRIDIARELVADSKRSFWAMADQGIVSLGNFGLNIALARHFERNHDLGSYGAFWVLMELMFFMNGIQAALVTYPLTVRGAVLDSAGLGKLATQSLCLTLLGGPLMIAALIGTVLVIQLPAEIGLWAGLALLFWQLQETTRRALMAHLRFRVACVGDAISYFGQFLAVVALSSGGMLDLTRTFQAIALTSLIGALLQVVQLGPRRTSFREIVNFARTCWSLGQWLLLGNLTNLFPGTLFNWNLAYWAGLERLGVFQALINLIRPAHPLAFAVATLVTPQAAQVRRFQGLRAAKMVSMRLAVLGFTLLVPFLALLFFLPRLSLAIAYGRDSVYLEHTFLVQLAAISVALVFIATVGGAFLNGVERTRQSFLGQATYAAAFILIAMPFTALFGLLGAFWGRLIASVLCVAVVLRFIHLLRDDAEPELTATAHADAGTQPVPEQSPG